MGVPCEDAVTNGVNAAKPIIDSLSEEEKNSIELIITSSESGIDFGKSISTVTRQSDLQQSRQERLQQAIIIKPQKFWKTQNVLWFII